MSRETKGIALRLLVFAALAAGLSYTVANYVELSQ